jgi:hypothetical protein
VDRCVALFTRPTVPLTFARPLKRITITYELEIKGKGLGRGRISVRATGCVSAVAINSIKLCYRERHEKEGIDCGVGVISR